MFSSNHSILVGFISTDVDSATFLALQANCGPNVTSVYTLGITVDNTAIFRSLYRSSLLLTIQLDKCKAGQKYSNQQCVSCERGEYNPYVNQTACLKCEIGTYNDLQGQSNCTLCDEGAPPFLY
jgi:hypothetical protein